jgi:hypothetical protein
MKVPLLLCLLLEVVASDVATTGIKHSGGLAEDHKPAVATESVEDEAINSDVPDAGDDLPAYNGSHHMPFGGDYPYGDLHKFHGEDGMANRYNTDYSNDDYLYGDEPWYKRLLRKHGWILNYITGVLLVFLFWSFVQFHKDPVKNWWGRRVAAARYKRAKKDDSIEQAGEDPTAGSEDEPTFFETLKLAFTKDPTTKCVVEGVGGKAITMDVRIGSLQKVSELPFLLQEGCRYSGNGELAALSLVDLWLKDRAQISFTLPNGQQQAVGKATTTPAMVRKAKTFKVIILPQTTR